MKYYTGWAFFKLVPYDKLPKKAVIVAGEQEYQETESLLRKVHYAPELSGRINPGKGSDGALAGISTMKQLLYTATIDEVIFCINGLSYAEIFARMQECGNSYDYKIHLPGSKSFVGSNSSHTSGDLYTIDHSFNLDGFAFIRNKRVLDMALSSTFIFLFPFTFFLLKRPFRFLKNCFLVLAGKYTWVSYMQESDGKQYLPKIKRGIIPPYNILESYSPIPEVKEQLNLIYAQRYTPGTDIMLVLKNFKYLGGV